MWPFRKKKQIDAVPLFATVLCIPGSWNDDTALKLGIVEATGGSFIAAGGVLMDVAGKQHFTLEITEADDRMEESFSVAGSVTGVSAKALEEVANHTSVAYISCPSGNIDKAKSIAKAGAAVLKAGGMAIKVETAGKAFEKERWLDLLSKIDEFAYYDMFVVDSIYDDQTETTFSCGMQNFGLKDTIVSGIQFSDAADLIRLFGYYQLVDRPSIIEGQTFSCDVSSPRFRILEEKNPPYVGDELLGNPFGTWRLVPE